MRVRTSGVVIAATALALVACGSTTTTASAPAATPTATATAGAPTGPPKAGVTFTGDPSVSGAMTIGSIGCSFPSLDGSEIVINGASAVTPSISIRLTFTGSSVAVLLDSGSGTSFHARDFSGTGVSGFDPTTGVQFSGPVSDTTPSNGSPGSIGAVKSVSGTVDCAGQTTGTSTIALSGTVAQGAASGTLTSVHVVCNPANGEVETFGLTKVGGAPAYTVVFQFSGHFTMDLLPSSGPAEFFTSTASASVTTTPTGATVSGDATEQVAPGATASTIHVSGQSTCGSSISP